MKLRDIVLAGFFSLGMTLSCSQKRIQAEGDFDGDGKKDLVYADCKTTTTPAGNHAINSTTCYLKIAYGNGKKINFGKRLGSTTKLRAYDRDGDGDIDIVAYQVSEGCGCSDNYDRFLRNDGDRKWTPITIVR